VNEVQNGLSSETCHRGEKSKRSVEEGARICQMKIESFFDTGEGFPEERKNYLRPMQKPGEKSFIKN